ncbi:alcohol dehydrogenase catalytic domain-containing protein [Sphingomonas sp. IC081]|uniref:alcohol dehydrogenase catalytic domain-containing protein n=1 Tax=Sphingomonas sp. IC081 TaxID=304378 RepID=UPI00115B2C4E|nr:alcohol dehydrogenase catalytic domain-containing protein [Sphingomonas sp. IC081]QDK35187.1 alcohol dehydrogenase [Sphingomonas sp. IC081]
MRAAIYPGHGGPVTIETLADPRPAPGEVLIRVSRCGICGTDLAMTRGGAWDYGSGVQFGHEYAGEIVELGREVSAFRVGDRIAVMPSLACGRCTGCRAHGNAVLCQDKQGSAILGFSELAAIPQGAATKLPAVLSMADGALIEPLAISLYGVQLAAIRPGDSVLVLGAGSVALYAIYWARRMGAGRIAVMSRSPRRAALALDMGAERFIAFGENEAGERLEALGWAPAVVLECVGAQGMLMKALSHVAPLGRILSLGFCTAPDPVIPALGSHKCASIQFSVGYSMREFLYIADQVDKGHVDPKRTISSTVTLDELPATLAMLRSPNAETKVHVTF